MQKIENRLHLSIRFSFTAASLAVQVTILGLYTDSSYLFNRHGFYSLLHQYVVNCLGTYWPRN